MPEPVGAEVGTSSRCMAVVVCKSTSDGASSSGRLMAYLERENLLDNTVVIYAGDQGFFLGENGWFDKRWIYEESMRMPLIVHWPEGIEAGAVNEQLVQNLDLAPTVSRPGGHGSPRAHVGRVCRNIHHDTLGPNT